MAKDYGPEWHALDEENNKLKAETKETEDEIKRLEASIETQIKNLYKRRSQLIDQVLENQKKMRKIMRDNKSLGLNVKSVDLDKGFRKLEDRLLGLSKD